MSSASSRIDRLASSEATIAIIGSESVASEPAAPSTKGRERLRLALRLLLAAAYAFAGYAHLRSPETFMQITPGWVPYAREVILVTGVLEIAGAVGLLVPRLRRAAAIGLALYAVCVFPANIKHALDTVPSDPGTLLYHVPRLLFQPVIVWWALFAGGVVDWPFKRRVG